MHSKSVLMCKIGKIGEVIGGI